ncbi:amino acid ABC transporter substrate-binding protein [Fundicoccus culcitae]|uniref:Amino acid ABC transporter substrate-binding protein n=1 Tax=Fundicoccus culcitae TaxID=2969821 RepID=A0ABY5P7A6_9LACT|nr:amino acid ABC transporter substrate-binding protein [Fundicoccus culcitae]UUX34480.1 amino acid ABC transporter substrate-binding protein [Fundicoccus culcitae]
MKKMIKVLISILAAFFMLQNTVSAQSDKVINNDEGVVIGFDDTFAPFGFKNDEGEYVGFDLELAAEVFNRMGVEYSFQPIDWSMKETELNTGNIDMIWNGYSITEEREKVVLFSDPYIENRQVIIVPVDSEINSKADLAGKFLATQEQSASLEAILAEEDFVSSLADEPITYATFVEVFSDLNNGRVDAIVVDETMASYYLEQSGDAENYRMLDENFGEEEYAVGFRQSDVEFVEMFNTILKDMMDDGTFAEIKSNWFSEIEAE